MKQQIEKKIEEKEVTEYLPCILSDNELIVRSKELAKANEDLSTVEDRKKDMMADFTAQQKKIEANINVLSRTVSQGKEYRNVKCKLVLDFTIGKKEIIRLDTFEIIRTEQLSQSDRQSAIMQ